VQRLIHLVMLLALLLGGSALPAAAMPCCNAQAAPAVKVQQDDAMADMPSCHHAAAVQATATLHCAHNVCAPEQRNAPVSEAAPTSIDATATPILVESRIPTLTTGYPTPPPALHPPSPPTAMPLPLRV